MEVICHFRCVRMHGRYVKSVCSCPFRVGPYSGQLIVRIWVPVPIGGHNPTGGTDPHGSARIMTSSRLCFNGLTQALQYPDGKPIGMCLVATVNTFTVVMLQSGEIRRCNGTPLLFP